MTKLDWEKQNAKEKPKEYLSDMERHARRRASQKRYRLRKKAEGIKEKQRLQNEGLSFESGKSQERHRIILLILKETKIPTDVVKSLIEKIERN